MEEVFDVIIIGGGPAGVSAGVYVARKKLKALLITDKFGGQSLVSNEIKNWIGDIEISGVELAKRLEDHLRSYKEIKINASEKVTKVKEIKCGYALETDKGGNYETKTIIVASGGRRRHLGVPGEDKYEGKGVAYCSTCDAPLFKDKVVAVVGAGNAGLEAVIDLLPYSNKIYLINNSFELKGDATTQEKVKKSDKVSIIDNAKVKEIFGDTFVKGLKYEDLESKQTKELAVEGVMVEIGTVPNSEMVKDLVETNKHGEIIVDQETNITSKKGIYAAGDVTNEIYKQNNIAVGEAIKAVLSAYNFLLQIKKKSPAADCEHNY